MKKKGQIRTARPHPIEPLDDKLGPDFGRQQHRGKPTGELRDGAKPDCADHETPFPRAAIWPVPGCRQQGRLMTATRARFARRGSAGRSCWTTRCLSDAIVPSGTVEQAISLTPA